MKKIVSLLMALLLVLGLAACAGTGAATSAAGNNESTAPAAAETTAKPAEDVTISFYGRFDPQGADVESAYFLKKVEEFNNADNGIKVETVFVPQEKDYIDRISTDMASGDFPSVFMEYGGSRILDYADADLLLDLKPYYDADQNWYNSIGETYWKPVLIDGHDGIYGTPFGAYVICLVYNQKYLDQFNLEVPKTWEDVMKASAVLKENGIQPFLVGETDNYRFGHLFSNLAITAYGKEAEKIGSREIGYDSEEAKKIYNLMVDAYSKGYFGDNILSVNASQERAYMGEGKSAFMWDLTSRIYWLENTKELNDQNLHITYFPAVNPEYSQWAQGGASQAWYVTNQGTEAETEAAVTFLKYITSTDFISGLAGETNATYAVKSESSSDIYIYKEVAEIMANTKVAIQELQNFDSQPGAIAIVRDSLQSIALGASADEVAKSITDGFADLK